DVKCLRVKILSPNRGNADCPKTWTLRGRILITPSVPQGMSGNQTGPLHQKTAIILDTLLQSPGSVPDCRGLPLQKSGDNPGPL
ncbi:MAG TPA: hypothetical protein VKA68_02470, partial [bacterium]|nr:hypothetical protein [bacterium]